MKTSFSKKQVGIAVACALALSFVAGAARAQSRNIAPLADRQIWVDTSKQVWMNGFGECWHSDYGPPPGYGPCNPAPIAQYVAPAPAPYVAPAPAPVQYVAPAPAPVVAPAPLPRKKDRN